MVPHARDLTVGKQLFKHFVNGAGTKGVAQKQVLRLDVAVYDVALLAEMKGGHDLLDDGAHYFFFEWALPAQLLIQVAVRRVLHHAVDVLVVVEEAV